MYFWSKIKGVKTWTQNDKILRVKQFLLSFAHYYFVFLETLDSDCK